MAQMAAQMALTVGVQLVANALRPKNTLPELMVSAATYGIPVPRCWGTVRIPGNMIWCGKITKGTYTAGKGGMLGKQSEPSYYASFAFAFARGPAVNVLKIWADNKMVYDITGATPRSVLKKTPLSFTMHYGTEDQLQDTTMLAEQGTNAVPAYRGLVYLVANQVPLAVFGNRIPTISAEIVFPTGADPQTAVNTALLSGSDTFQIQSVAYDFKRELAYMATGSGISVVDLNTMQEVRRVTTADILDASQPPFANSQFMFAVAEGADVLYASCGASNSRPIIRIAKDSLIETGRFGVSSAALSNTATSGVRPNSIVVQELALASATYDLVLLCSEFGGFLLLDGFLMTEAWAPDYAPLYIGNGALNAAVATSRVVGVSADFVLLSGAKDEAAFQGTHATFRLDRLVVVGPGAAAVTDGRTFGYADFFQAGEGDPASGVFVASMEYDPTLDRLLLGVTTYGGAVQRLVSLNRDWTTAWNIAIPFLGNAAPSGQSQLTAGTYAYLAPGGALTVIDTRTGATMDGASFSGVGGEFGQTYDAMTGALYSVSPNGDLQRLMIVRAPRAGNLGAVVADICAGSGLGPSDIDVSELTDPVGGFQADRETGRDSIAALAQAFSFDVVESNDVLAFRKRNRAPAATVDYADVTAAKGAGSALSLKLKSELEIPRRVNVRYSDPGPLEQITDNGDGTLTYTSLDFQTNVQHWTRAQKPDAVSTTAAVAEMGLDTRVCMSGDAAKTLAQRTLTRLWTERQSYEGFGLGPKFLRLEPTDVILLGTSDGAQVRLRLEQVDLGADWTLQCSGVVEDTRIAGLSQIADSGSGGGAVAPAPASYGVTSVVGANLPLLQDSGDLSGSALRAYAMAGPLTDVANYGGATIYDAPDNASWTQLAAAPTAMAYGVAVSALPAPASAWLTDGNTLTVAMTTGTDQLTSATRLQVLNGANAAALISQDGRAEILQFQTVTPVGNGRYQLSGLLRGRRGTDGVMGAHRAGDRFVLLSSATVVPLAVPLGRLGTSEYLRTLAPGETLDAATSRAVTWTGAAEKPYAPVHITGSRNGAGDLAVRWTRRTRLGGEWTEAIETVPLGEATEAYQIDVLNGAAVVRTISGLTGPGATYTAAQQIADFGAAQAQVTVNVYQLSATVGRGYPGSASV